MVLFLLGVIVVVASAAYLTRDREPSYQGKPLSYWVERNAPDLLNPSLDQEAVSAIQNIGTNALPFLLEWISYDRRQHWVKNATMACLRRLPDIDVLDNLRMRGQLDLSEGRAELAASAFQALGKEAAPATPQLTKLLSNSPSASVSGRTITALQGIGEPALPVLFNLATNDTALHRAMVVGAFGSFPTLRTNADTVPLLIRSLDDRDDKVAWTAALSLTRIARNVESRSPQILPAITSRLGTNMPRRSQMMAMFMLSRYGPGAEEHISPLLNALASADPEVRESATNALMKIAPEALTNAPPQF